MSIANLKAKVVSITQSNKLSNDNSVSKKLEVVTTNLKSTPTIIARDLKIEGDVYSSGVVEIEGFIKGTIKARVVVLREDGFVEGIIIADLLTIKGKFEGSIKAKNVNIANKAQIIGVVEYDSLSVEDGASIDGQFKKLS